MKRLLPSLREKKRYVVLEATPEKIIPAIESFVGVLGMSKINPVLIKSGKRSILRINHRYVDEVIVALSTINAQIIRVSGILKKAQEDM